MDNKYEKIHNSVVTKGYYVGTFDDFFDDVTGITLDDFNRHAHTFIESGDRQDVGYVYRHNYIDQHTQNYLKNSKYNGPIPTEEDILDEIRITNKQKRKDFIKSLQSTTSGIRTTQQWGRLELGSFDGVDESFRRRVRAMEGFFRSFFKKFSAAIYPELNPETCSTAYQFSLYENEDFSEVHYDGVNPTRVCVVIMYFSDPNTYNTECGGELYIETTDKQVIEIKPVLGNYAILDFTKFNLGHGIRAVGNNYRRFALQCFIGH